ncbi:MAG: YifB family Mg chelatase-like AAA ATPase [Christensenellales bacterium]
MLAKVKCYTLVGIDGVTVDVEVDLHSGLASYDTVGLPDAAVKESRERIRSAIKNSGYSYPVRRITVNLAPADIKKEGPCFDLAIATGLLVASGQLESDGYKDYVVLGELSLGGELRKVNGVLPILISAKMRGYKKFVIPFGNRKEASFIEGIEVYALKSLKEATEFFSGAEGYLPVEHSEYGLSETGDKRFGIDFCEVKGQNSAKRALEIAVAGGHNVLLSGPPGAGKSMLAKCVPTIMPAMSFDEALEVTKIHSVAGILDENAGIVTERPFRTPHHTATTVALIGGGKNCRPGEISLAHNGVLYLDEMPEYSRSTLETLRQPLEDGRITVSRASGSVEYPARFMLIASMNPCPCGNYGSKTAECTCSFSQIKNYRSRISGPLMDRIDLNIEVDGVSYENLTDATALETSEAIRSRVEKARDIQRKRFSDCNIHTNAEMSNSLIKKFCVLDEACSRLAKVAFEKLNLSARGLNRILKVARTIADLDGAENISTGHLAEAIQYRSSMNG